MKYTVSIETLSPLHIGTGTELLKDFDYVSVKETTFVINQDAVYGDEFATRGGEARLNVPPGRLVSADQWRENSPWVRYTLQGATTIERVREQIKDVYGCCYLPGSSLKGALRTGLLSHVALDGKLDQIPVNYHQNNRGNFVKESAAQNFEHKLFRPQSDDANHDLMRALHVADSQPIPLSPSKLVLCSARVFTGGQPGSPIVVEAVQKGAVFNAEILIDELTLQYAELLGWEKRTAWLTNLIPVLQQVSRYRIEQELQNARSKGFEMAERFYLQLGQFAEKLAGTQSILLQLGWGTGWSGMTIGPWLPKSVQDEARQNFQLGRPPGQHGRWEPDLNKPYPKSRRLRANGDMPGVPFGWVALTFQPDKPPTQLWQSLSTPVPIISKKVLDTAVSSPVPASPQPSNPQPASAAPPPKPAITTGFTKNRIPKPGEHFIGVTFDGTGPKLLLEIPGLDPDNDGYALVEAVNNRSGDTFRSGLKVVCEVMRVEEESRGYWCVHCKSIARP